MEKHRKYICRRCKHVFKVSTRECVVKCAKCKCSAKIPNMYSGLKELLQ